jgi:hypothetical protein
MKSPRAWPWISALITAGALAASVRANTIQPIFVSATPLGGGNYSYVYDLQLTAHNGLSADASFPSSVTIVDFGTLAGTPTLSTVGSGLATAYATSTSDWLVTTATTGAALPNAVYVPTTLTLFGNSNKAATDDFAGTNVTVRYTNISGLAEANFQRSLVQLTVVSNIAPGVILQSLSMNTALGTVNQADTFPVAIGAVVPVPAAAWAGLSMLGSLGLWGLARRRRLA